CDIRRSVNRLLTAAPNVLFVDERRGIALQRKIVHGLVLGLRRGRRVRLGAPPAVPGAETVGKAPRRTRACAPSQKSVSLPRPPGGRQKTRPSPHRTRVHAAASARSTSLTSPPRPYALPCRRHQCRCPKS